LLTPIAAAAAVLPTFRAMRDDSELVHLPVSVDTYHARVAEAAVAAGADMVNDVTGGLLDPAMLPTVARLGVPYCLMHMRGDLANMTQVSRVFLAERVHLWSSSSSSSRGSVMQQQMSWVGSSVYEGWA
jgi:2-amino-4-hydroxy-6-hydroxymethyldihydropteridine diphosphokinase/dihydropteroate synthase